MKIVCLGDSTTYGMGVLRRECWSALAARETGHTLVNRGICGDTAGGMLARFERDVLQQNPDVAILMGGGNDIVATGTDLTARASLFAMLQQSAAAGIQPVLGTPLPFDAKKINPEWAELTDFSAAAQVCRGYAAWIRRLGAVFHVPVADFYGLFESLPGVPGDWYMDGLHPGPEGHKKMAALIVPMLTDIQTRHSADEGKAGYHCE